jgi:hypothetical protein
MTLLWAENLLCLVTGTNFEGCTGEMHSEYTMHAKVQKQAKNLRDRAMIMIVLCRKFGVEFAEVKYMSIN